MWIGGAIRKVYKLKEGVISEGEEGGVSAIHLGANKKEGNLW